MAYDPQDRSCPRSGLARTRANLASMDPAFVWQQSSPPPPPRGWISLDDAAALTGVPVSTIRNWARKQRVTSRLRDGGRVVLRSEVLARASELGRLTRRPETEPTSPPEPPPEPEPAAGMPPPPPIPEGSMLVPIDEWRRILGQLGNLHEAGQQLAEARERAAKAETEATFLKERLKEMRSRLEEAQPEPASPPPADPEPTPLPEATEHEDPVWVYLVRRWARRRTRR